MAKLVEKTYGDALFDLALENGKTDELYEETKAVQAVFKENDELVRLLNHPKISKEDKEKVVENIFKERVSADMTGFLLLVIKKDRQKYLDKIFTYFIDKVKEDKKIGVASVTTAYEMNDSQKKAVEDRLIQTTKYETFEIEYIVDGNIIGGMIIRIGDKIIDSSIKNKIEKMSRELYKIRLERW